MSCFYACSSCRQLVETSSRLQCPRWARRASYVSLRGRPSPAQAPTSSPRDAVRNGRHSPSRHETSERYIPSEYDRYVEDDFLERLFENRDPGDLGPYSKGPHRKRREEREKERMRLLEARQKKERHASKALQATFKTSTTSRSAESHESRHLSKPSRKPTGVLLQSGLRIPYYKSQETPRNLSGSIPEHSNGHSIQATVSSFGNHSLLDLIDGTSPLRSTSKSPLRTKLLRSRVRRDEQRNESKGRDRRVTFLKTLQPSTAVERSLKTISLTQDTAVTSHSPSPIALEDLEGRILDPSLTSAQSYQLYLDLCTGAKFDLVAANIERGLLRKITKHFCDVTGPARRRPSPSEALSKLKSEHQAYTAIWQETIWSLLVRTFPILSGTENRPSESYTERHTLEIAELWKQYLVRNSSIEGTRKKSSLGSNPTGWDALSASEMMATVRGWSTKDFATRFFQFFDENTQTILRAVPGVDTAALASFVVFRMHLQSNLGKASVSPRACAPFMRFLSQLIPYSNVTDEIANHKAIIAMHCSYNSDVQNVVSELRNVSSNAVSVYAEVEAAEVFVVPEVNSKAGNETRHVRADMFRKRIGRALEDQNILRVEALWREAQTAFHDVVASGTVNNIPSIVYSHFLMTFMALRRPNRAIDVWNDMVQNNVPLIVGTWDAMLKGCGRAKDPKSLEAVWQKMIQSGVQPDAQVWATRIHGLATTGYWESGIRVFHSMTKTWVEAVQQAHQGERLTELPSLGDVAGVPKPNTQCLNSLVLGLARGRKYRQLAEIVSSAKAIGVKADVYTFNPLFRTALQDGDMELATRVLRQMGSLGIKPDIASFTMLLESLFREDEEIAGNDGKQNVASTVTSHDSSMDVKHEAALEIFRDMEQAGIEANAWSFSTLINGLLKSTSKPAHTQTSGATVKAGNLRAAHTVLAHMAANSIPLSSQIYTTLVTHHFSVDPPDLAAIESLWNRARADPQVFLDVVFFDRLIEGLAGTNEIGRMMTALGQAVKRGKVPGWIAMKEVVAALGRAGDWDRIEDIVSGVRREELELKDEQRARKGRNEFWDLVESMGFGGPGGLHPALSEPLVDEVGVDIQAAAVG